MTPRRASWFAGFSCLSLVASCADPAPPHALPEPSPDVTLPAPPSASVTASAPRVVLSVAPSPAPAPRSGSRFAVVVAPGWVDVVDSGARLGPGCKPGAASGHTQTVAGGKLDGPALKACFAALKSRAPEETQLTLYADKSVEYALLVAVMDAARDHLPEMHLAVQPAASP
ncbi:MAG: hypothetical protein IPG04_11195 [Polyangiaceae bacterium]|nr:hypothetical protein [Polyangiaceae bacterium]